jgi:hypothetical protein
VEPSVHLKERLKFCQGFRARCGGGRACLARAQCSSTNHPRPRGTFQVLSVRRGWKEPSLRGGSSRQFYSAGEGGRAERTESARWRQQTVLLGSLVGPDDRSQSLAEGLERTESHGGAYSAQLEPHVRSTRIPFRFRPVRLVSSSCVPPLYSFSVSYAIVLVAAPLIIPLFCRWSFILCCSR